MDENKFIHEIETRTGLSRDKAFEVALAVLQELHDRLTPERLPICGIHLQRPGYLVFEHLGPEVPLHFSAFHPDWKMRDKRPTPVSTLVAARDIARRAGLRHVYTGNIRDESGQSTYCRGCGSRVIGRDWYAITCWNLSADGCCEQCGAVCAGVFASAPGAWGRRRRSVVVSEAAR